ncbi:MAG TPA: peptidoglycan DD-metalloendopeptidase family protein [Thiobacillaceae bacterium]|nr:peptidoglycan DD-metalloendopeptidase family protein [Thiobacillaceae bacterium]HNU64573.1 peptidoglycan DD-metalloendopeptidase family protein [Thiobacillaceae bacterium]
MCTCLLRGFLWLCFGLWVAAAQAAPDGRQEELDDLRTRIRALQKEVEQAAEDRSEAADALKKSERGISDMNRGLRELEQRQRGLSADLKQLARDTEATRTEIDAQRKRLAELLRQRYIHGDNDVVKLMLNGQNPGESARSLEYYGYIGRARRELIRAYQGSLARMQALQATVRERQASLEQTKQERVARKKSLETEKAARQQVLFKLSSQIRRQRNEIRTLERDEKRLTQLIERLARLAAARKAAKPVQTRPGEKVERVADASLAGLDFARLKGKLALPVAGEILHRFGQDRPGGGPAWKGLFIRARQGQEVRAVGTGKVAFADWLRGFGNLLIIDHGDGYLSLYSNNESLYKQAGDPVRAGDVVATVGASGGQDEPGLYFELRRQGKPFNPMAWVR